MTRVVFLGTPGFALPTLRALHDSDQVELAGVFTQPDRPAGRGRRLAPPPVKRLATEWGVPVWQPERIRGNHHALELVERSGADVMVVAAFGQILPAEFFQLPPWGTLNVHASILPRYRGAAPVVHALLDGAAVSGATIMKIDEGLDTGDILATARVAIGPEMNAGELEELIAQEGAELLLRVLPDYLAGRLVPHPQDSEQASYAPRVKPQDCRLDWGLPAADLHNRIRAYNPRPGARTRFRSESLKIWRSRLPSVDEEPLSEAPGAILGWTPEGVRVACGDRRPLELVELQRPGRGRLSAADFANGVSLRVGEALG